MVVKRERGGKGWGEKRLHSLGKEHLAKGEGELESCIDRWRVAIL